MGGASRESEERVGGDEDGNTAKEGWNWCLDQISCNGTVVEEKGGRMRDDGSGEWRLKGKARVGGGRVEGPSPKQHLGCLKIGRDLLGED